MPSLQYSKWEKVSASEKIGGRVYEIERTESNPIYRRGEVVADGYVAKLRDVEDNALSMFFVVSFEKSAEELWRQSMMYDLGEAKSRGLAEQASFFEQMLSRAGYKPGTVDKWLPRAPETGSYAVPLNDLQETHDNGINMTIDPSKVPKRYPAFALSVQKKKLGF
jgi:hypothetical protein